MDSAPVVRVGVDRLDAFCFGALKAVAASDATARAATDAMMHGSIHGVDSHGVRLLPHYVQVIEKGRVKREPKMAFRQTAAATGVLEAGDGHGALAAYTAMEHAIALGESAGMGAVAIRNSSHFGPAGAFALRAAERGYIGLAVCNADSLVRLHDGAERFHGTNPIAFAAPVAGERPWMLDMATSSVSFNKIRLYRISGHAAPGGVGSDEEGRDTTDPNAITMLAPVGGTFGFKGAGLAGMVDILSAALTGMAFSHEMISMFEGDLSRPRRLGAFVLAMKPSAFVEDAVYQDGIRRYREAVRASAARPGTVVMAPGDREWAEAERRRTDGIPLDGQTVEDFGALARAFGLDPLPPVQRD